MDSIIIPDQRNLLCLDTYVHGVTSKMFFFPLKETGRSLTSPLINSIMGVKMKNIKQNDVECKLCFIGIKQSEGLEINSAP